MFRIIPRDTSFFDMFAAMSNNLIDAARALVELFADYRDVDAKIEEIRRIEHLGDEMTHSIMRKLNQTFITPFDREDIHTLASSLDDVVDFINAACARILMYRITDPPSEAGTLARLILAQAEELGKAVSILQKSELVLAHCVEINRLENEADQVSRVAIARLFEGETDPITLIKMKELLEFLETRNRQGGRCRRRTRNRRPEECLKPCILRHHRNRTGESGTFCCSSSLYSVALDLRLPQRISRRRQQHRHRRFHARAVSRSWPWCGPPSSISSPPSSSAPPLPRRSARA